MKEGEVSLVMIIEVCSNLGRICKGKECIQRGHWDEPYIEFDLHGSWSTAGRKWFKILKER